MAIVVGCVAMLFLVLGIWRATSGGGMPLRANCSKGQPIHASLDESSNAVLRKLAEYESVCKGAVVDRLMVFMAMPHTTEEADTLAKDTVRQLKQFSRQGIEPLVVFEPSVNVPDVLTNIAHGTYNATLATYFQNIKKGGVTDGAMGTWVLLPEANTPIWQVTDSVVFGNGVTAIANELKTVYPKGKVSIMLNSTTYPNNDTNWAYGESKSLKPYVAQVRSGLLDSVGLQGFPHISSPNDPIPTANDFIPADLVMELADVAGTKNVWLNTGTFKRTNMGGMQTEVTLTTDQRKTLLDGILLQALKVHGRSYATSVNIFAEDKSDAHEHTDWSYWQPGKMTQSKDTAILDQFIRSVRQNSLGLSLYDH